MKSWILIIVFLLPTIAFSNTYRPTNAAQVMPRLHGGWGPSFSQLAQRLDNDKNYITWIIHSPEFVMDLRSAKHFQASMMSDMNAMKANGISHMMVAWQCHIPNGRRLRGATGFTGEGENQTQKLIENGWGLSSFFGVFHDSELNAADHVENNIQRYTDNDLELAHVTFEVSAADCQRMIRWVQRFIDHPNQPGTRFGLNLDARKFEGGGCGSFAAAMLEAGGVLPEVQKRLDRSISGPRYLLGGGQQLPPRTTVGLPDSIVYTPRHIPMNELLNREWAPNDGPSLTMTDPELGLLAMRTIAHQYVRGIGRNPAILETSGFRHRIVQSRRRHVDDRGMARMKRFAYHYNENFDSQARAVAQHTRNGLSQMLNQGKKMEPVYLNKYWGLLITR